MRKLLNTLYITNEKAYLCLDGENLVCRIDEEEKFRIPFDNVESVVCFSYIGCSPAVMGKCAEKLIPISFISPSGKFLAKVYAGTRGNVFLRVAQLDMFKKHGLELAKNVMAAKFTNSLTVIRRSRHDNAQLRNDCKMDEAIERIKEAVSSVLDATSIEEVLGIEGNCAKVYFGIFGKLLNSENNTFEFRSKRPPLDPVNTTLSFVYTLLTNEYSAALETVGLDSYIGFYHQLRSGRASLACDLVEESRCLVDRFVITLFNLNVLSENDFHKEETGAVYLNDEGRKKVITKWQEKKKTDMQHSYLKKKIQFGLLPYVQSNLLAKYIRGEIDEYPCYLNKIP